MFMQMYAEAWGIANKFALNGQAIWNNVRKIVYLTDSIR